MVQESQAILYRVGMSGVRVRVVGDASLAWAEAAVAWGCSVEAVVVSRRQDYKAIVRLTTSVTPITFYQALQVFTPKHWNGILAATIHEIDEATLVDKLFHKWRPAIALIALPCSLSKRQALSLLPDHGVYYRQQMLRPRHSNVGGVTATSWHVVHLRRLTIETLEGPPSMTMNQYPRSLQTVLDDTLGSNRVAESFENEPSSEGSSVGQVRGQKSGNLQPVYSATRLGPDLSTMRARDRLIWVKANSVRSPHPVLRQVNIHELHAMWDYEGKLECKHWSQGMKYKVLSYRLLSPPAKIVRLFLFQAADAIKVTCLHHDRPATTTTVTAGLTKNVPFSAMEQQIAGRAEATISDDAEVDLSTWALPGETPEQAAYRAILRRFALKWWANNLENEANAWLATHGNSAEDREAIEDCIRRAKACTYWQWTRGSRLFFWRFPEEFRADMRDGVEFFHLGPPPGPSHTITQPSLEMLKLKGGRRSFS